MTRPFYTITSLAEFGGLTVYERGRWAQRERLPKYFVLRESDRHTLCEFRRLRSALVWAEAQQVPA